MTADLPLSLEDVAEIVAILDRTTYERIDIKTRRFALSVARSGDGWTQSWEWPQEQLSPAAGISAPGSTASPAVDDDDPADGFFAIRAQLPGTFYRTSQPGAAPFVELGSRVEPGTVVGIIETMKLMTPVHAGVTGTVAAILVDTGQPVDALAELIRVKPADQ